MKTIGVIGGSGPQATMDFEARVHAVSQRLIPQRTNSGYPPMLVYYHRTLPFVTNADGSPVLPMQMHPSLQEKVKAVGAACDFLVITSNASHTFQADFEQISGRKVLSMIDVTLEEVRKLGWRKIGLLGFGEPRVYMAPLDQMGVPYETLSGELAELRNRLDRAILAVMEGSAGREETALAIEIVEVLRTRGVDGVILGCTEIPLLMEDKANASDLINPLALLAEAAVRYAME